MKLGKILKSAVVVATLAVGSAAQAVPITGAVSFGGSWVPTGGPIATATGVDVIGNLAIVSCALTTTCTGSYAPLTGAIVATYNDFVFAPLPGGGIVPLWTFTVGPNTYSFDLLTVVIDEQDADSLVLKGTGMLHITGLTSTMGTWSFSGDTAGAIFAFSSTTNVPVPEPGSMALLGLGLLGFGLARRKRA